MSHPLIAIVGRPNVGKSRLFNRLTGKFKALVDDTAGVTRDRHYGFCDWAGRTFVVIDTGGLIPGSENPLNQKVWGQAFEAIQEADAIVCLFDGREGLTPVDEMLVGELRKSAKPCFYAVNKIDVATQEKMLADFARLGVEPLISVSAEHGRGVADLLDALYKCPTLAGGKGEKASDTSGGELRVCIVGRPNVGKSTLLNQLAGEERAVVHEEAGTTRDAIDVAIERDGKHYLFVDTAGIQRKSKTKTRLEKFTVLSSLRAIEHAQVALLLLDARDGLTHHDLTLAHHVWNAGKGLILLVNKWDLVQPKPRGYPAQLASQLGELQNVPILCMAAKTGENCGAIWPRLDRVASGLNKRMETHRLNVWLEGIMADHPPPAYRGRAMRLYYATQTGTAPPHVVCFVNEPKGMAESYRRFLKRELSRALELEGMPIRLSFRKRGKR